MEKKANAYRAIFKEDKEAYETDPSVLPNLTGKYFNSYEGYTNNYQYIDDIQYLHFWDNLEEAVLYAKSLKEATNKNVSVAMFSFPDELLKECTFTGRYFSNSSSSMMRVVDKKEYIIPLNFYNPNENLVGFMSDYELDKKMNPPPCDPDSYMNKLFF